MIVYTKITKKILPIILVLLFAISAKCENTPFTIIHFSDSHSFLFGTGQKNQNHEYTKGGIARAATYINTIRNTDSNVIVFHSGDIFTGDFFFNRYFSFPEYNILQRLGFDAIALGNHDFDIGPGPLYFALDSGFSGGSVPIVAANLDLSGFPALKQFISPYTIKQYDSIKLGIFGLTINDPSSNPFPVIIRDSIIQIASSTAAALDSSGCDVIICLSHLGLETDNYMASVVPGIHIILGGHDHIKTEQPVFVPNPSGFSTIICHPGSHYRYASKLKFNYNNGIVEFTNYEPVEINQTIPEDKKIKDYINSFKPGIIKKFGNVFHTITNAARDISPFWNDSNVFRDTPLGNFVTDAYRNLTGTQISMTAVGLMSESIYKGDVNGYDIFRAAPYGYDSTTGLGFKIVKFNISGAELKRGLELILAFAPENASYFPQLAGLRFDFDRRLPIGQRIIPSSMFVNDTVFSGSTIYSATGNGGILLALTQLGIQISNIMQTNIPEYTCLRNYADNFDNLNYESYGRIKDLSSTNISIENGRVNGFELTGNYPNPFNSYTLIKFVTKAPSRIVIKIYDIKGKEVAMPVNSNLEQGSHIIRFDAERLSSGVYFCRIYSENQSASTRMILVK